MTSMWTSKLGNKFPRELIDRLDAEHHRTLHELRRQPANARCAECGEGGTTWASVNLGVFLCVRCADVHRALGTHISKVKGCGGTYLWGPDEVRQMQDLGNVAAEARFTSCRDAKPAHGASKEERVEFCRRKYDQSQGRPSAPRQEALRSVSTSAGAGGIAVKAETGERMTPVRATGFSEDPFGDFDMWQDAKPRGLQHESEPVVSRMATAPMPASRVQTSSSPSPVLPVDSLFDELFGNCASLDASTAASEEEEEKDDCVSFRACFSGLDDSATAPAPDVAAEAPRIGSNLKDDSALWEDFGEW